MTKKIYTLCLIWIIAISNVIAQREYDLREKFIKSIPEHSSLLRDIYCQIDSLNNPKNKVAKVFLDSLSTDSLTNTLNGISLAMRMDLFVHYNALANNKMAQSQLLEAQNMAFKTGNNDSLMQSVHEVMARYFEGQSMWEAAAKSLKALWEIQSDMDHKTIGELESNVAEQKQELDNLNGKSKTYEANMDKYMTYLPYAVAGIGLLLVLMLWGIIRSAKWKGKWKDIKQQFEERSQTMDETQKMSVQFKNEGVQFKQTAEAAIGKMNEIEQAKVLATRQVQTWRDESTNELLELKDMIEGMTNNPSVTGYMQIQNQLSRFQTKNKEVLGQLESVLRK
ncbi:MAG: hypothetical protein RLZZ262_171 [Bacteroidota bacterium]|jgi:hypothetical protein